MRYYKIVLSGGKTFTSLVNGGTDPGALNVEFDVPVVPLATPMGAAAITIWGTGLQDISQAKNYVGQTIQVFGGMQKGLPLSNPAYAGLLFQGWVFQAFANWIGTEQTLDLIVQPGTPPSEFSQTSQKPAPPFNLVLNWTKGMTLQNALQNTLTTAYPGYTIQGTLSSNLVLAYDSPGIYGNLKQLAVAIKAKSRAILGGTYVGADISLSNKTFTLFDGTTASKDVKQVLFQDLIGQPTWIKSPSIQFKTAMRADIKVSDYINLPKTLINNTQQASNSLVNQNVNMQGKFIVNLVRHVGNYRQPTGESWVTIFECAPLANSAS